MVLYTVQYNAYLVYFSLRDLEIKEGDSYCIYATNGMLHSFP